MIELLIVLTLLAILLMATIIFLANNVLKSRDSVRKSHLEKYRVAFEEYYADYRRYPPEGSLNDCRSANLVPYMPEILCDPRTEEPYRYEVSSDGTQYGIYTNLENDDDLVIAEHGCDTGCGPDDNQDGEGDYNYGLTEEQVGTGGEAEFQPAGCTGPQGNFCYPNRCISCCPGVGWKCNALGNGCEKDVRCQ